MIFFLGFLFKRKQFPSKLIAFCNQSTKSTTSKFYAEFRNSLSVFVQLLSRASKVTNFHVSPNTVSYQSLALSPVTHLPCQVKMGIVTSLLSSLLVQQHIRKLISFFVFLYKFCDLNCISISYRK